MKDDRARARAEALFKINKQPQTAGEQARADYQRNQELMLARTARLRSLRLSREPAPQRQSRKMNPTRF